MTGTILTGDALSMLRTLPDESVHCCVTSPPYWGLRDYGVAGQIGLEVSPSAYVSALAPVFDEVRRVLRDDGTLWLNLGDSYVGYHGNKNASGPAPSDKPGYRENMRETTVGADGLGNKNLVGIPWRVAFALQERGWILRSDIIWHKPNPMPESVKDRPTRAHEYLFLLSRSPRYYYDAEAVREPAAKSAAHKTGGSRYSFRRAHSKRVQGPANHPQGTHRPDRDDTRYCGPTRARRGVWTVPTRPFPDAHFATFPPDLIRPCILAGCPVGGTVLDPFFGSGTVGQVCIEEGRNFIGIELNSEYVDMAERRIANARPHGPQQAFFRDVEAKA
ncbi:DNA-methyltransferase [Desulfovibrio sp. SGI.169]|uniref:DNA-methyltransferase n=1 Tax=Desulfovibrio sp. SGI.169 TaxID=3420561 RepID=UPI003CFEAC29